MSIYDNILLEKFYKRTFWFYTSQIAWYEMHFLIELDRSLIFFMLSLLNAFYGIDWLTIMHLEFLEYFLCIRLWRNDNSLIYLLYFRSVFKLDVFHKLRYLGLLIKFLGIMKVNSNWVYTKFSKVEFVIQIFYKKLLNHSLKKCLFRCLLYRKIRLDNNY